MSTNQRNLTCDGTKLKILLQAKFSFFSEIMGHLFATSFDKPLYKNPKRNLSFSRNVSNSQQKDSCIFPTQNSKASLKLPLKHFFSYLPFFNSSAFLPYRYQYHSKYEIFAEQGHNQTAKREINVRYNEKGK